MKNRYACFISMLVFSLLFCGCAGVERKAGRAGKITTAAKGAQRKIPFDYEVYSELKSIEREFALMNFGDEISERLLSALEKYLSGMRERGLAELKDVYRSAGDDRKPALAVLFIVRCSEIGKKEEAAEVLEELQSRFPDNPLTYLSGTYVEAQDIHRRGLHVSEFLEKMLKTAESDKRLFPWLYLLAYISGGDAQKKKVEEWLNEYIESYPDESAAFYGAIKYYCEEGKPGDAGRIYRTWEEYLPDTELSEEVLVKIARTYEYAGRKDEAQRLLEQAVELHPEGVKGRFALAEHMAAQRAREKALSLLDNITRTVDDPKLKAEAYRRMVRIYGEAKEREKMLSAARSAISLDPENPENFVRLAEGFVIFKEITEAMRNYQMAVALVNVVEIDYLKLYDYYSRLAELNIMQGSLDGYFENLEKSAEVRWHGGGQFTYTQLLHQYQTRAGLDAAERKAEELLIKYPDDYEFYLAAADIYRKSNKGEKEIELYEKAYELGRTEEDKLDTLYRLSQVHYRENQPEKARQVLEGVKKKYADSDNFHLRLNKLYIMLGEEDAAEDAFERALELASSAFKRVEYARETAQFYDVRGDVDRAIKKLKKLVKLKPEGRYAYELAQYCSGKGRYDEAVAAYHKAIAFSSGAGDEIARYQEKLAQVYVEGGRSKEAVKVMKSAVVNAPENSRLHESLARIYRMMGDYRSAAISYETAAEIAGNDKGEQIYILDQLADMLFREAGKTENALKVAERIIETAPGEEKGYFRLGEFYKDLEKPEEAAGVYERAVENLNPENDILIDYAKKTARIYVDLGRKSDAFGIVHKALKRRPKNYSLHDYLGDLYRDAEMYDEALAKYKKASALAPPGERIKYSRKIAEIEKKRRKK